MRAGVDNAVCYHAAQPRECRDVLEVLHDEICRALPDAENKVWHGHPVWFLEGNPVVGYSVLKGGPRLIFWSGQSFDEPGLRPEGSFKAAEARYTVVGDVKLRDLRRWMKKARDVQWDSKNIVKRKGVVKRLTRSSPMPMQRRAGGGRDVLHPNRHALAHVGALTNGPRVSSGSFNLRG